jgi:glycosyltransferase involved in cell wall biosynthesis
MTATNVFFSIVIPTYNREGLIMKTLDTVFNQTYKNYEVIVVDNCSTDNTEALLRPLAEQNKIKYIRHDRNYERSKSRNTGMRNASGDFLTFLDSDDFLYSTSLEEAARFVHMQSSIKFFHHYYELVSPEGKKIYSFPFPTGNALKSLLLGNFLSCIGVFISKEIYQAYSFDEVPVAIGSEDWDYWIRVMSKYDLGVIKKVCAGVVQHDNRTVTLLDYNSVLKRKDYYIEKYKHSTDLPQELKGNLNIVEAGYYCYAATIAFQSGKNTSGYKLLNKAVKAYPAVLGKRNFWRITFNPLKQFLKK